MASKITINNNGPLKIEGDFEILDSAGNAVDLGGKKAVFLCRCGTTKNIPFCDGSHKSCGFVSEFSAVQKA